MQTEISSEALKLHEDALVWDMVWPWEPEEDNDFDKLERIKKAGHNVLSATIAGDNQNISEAIQRIGEVRRLVGQYSEIAQICKTIPEIEEARRNNKLAVLLHFEGTRCFERNLDVISVFYDLGVKHNLLAFNNQNSVGGGAMDDEDAGLTKLGKRIVGEMQRVGMLVDLSHTGHRTAMDAMEISTKPCVYTHSNVNNIFPHKRNLSDEEIKACAETGGIVGISSSSMYHGDCDCRAETLFQHINYMVELVGDEHVGLGIDVQFDADALNAFMRARPDEWPDAADPNWTGVKTAIPEELPRVTECMLKANYSEQAIRNILGMNYMRLGTALWS